MTDEERLADLLIQWEEILEQGRDVSAADLCKDCPQLIEEREPCFNHQPELRNTSNPLARSLNFQFGGKK